MKRLGTTQVLKYGVIAAVLLLFGSIFYRRRSVTEFAQSVRRESQDHETLESSTISFVPTSAEVLHIGLVVQSYEDCRYASLQMKSLLMHRRNPLHLHLLTNTELIVILKTLISTWHVPYLNCSFYTTDEIPDSATPLSNLKLWLPSLIRETVEKLVVFDTDVIVGSDISALWQEFWAMRKEGKSLGLLPDPDNRGDLDVRLMLVNASAVRDVNLVRDFAQMVEQRDVVYRVTSPLNITPRCLVDTDPLNCVKVLSILSQDGSDTALEKLMSFNSYQLQSIDQAAPSESKQPSLGWWDWLTLSSSSICASMRRRLIYLVHPYFIQYSSPSRDTADITLITQLSFDRIHMLMRLLNLWKGPVSAAIYMEEGQLLHLMELIRTAPVFQGANVALHVVYKKGNLNYPVNFLRNIAWNYSTTPYVFLNDVDLMPSLDLYAQLKHALRSALSVNTAYVVPAFETPFDDLRLPSSKEALHYYMRKKRVSPFKWHVNKEGHKPTNYKKWFRATEPYEVRWEDRYEPYIVVRYNTTRYDERFVGYGQNKITHILELHTQRYQFVVVPNEYIIHYPHKTSSDKVQFIQTEHDIRTGGYYSCIRQIQEDFCKDLVKKYGHAPCLVSTPMGKKAISVSIAVGLLLVVGIVYASYCCCRLSRWYIYSTYQFS